MGVVSSVELRNSLVKFLDSRRAAGVSPSRRHERFASHLISVRAVWTRDVGKAHRIANSVRAGTVWINCYDVFDAAAPFGGFKMSGMGRELVEVGLANYTQLKTVTMNSG